MSWTTPVGAWKNPYLGSHNKFISLSSCLFHTHRIADNPSPTIQEAEEAAEKQQIDPNLTLDLSGGSHEEAVVEEQTAPSTATTTSVTPNAPKTTSSGTDTPPAAQTIGIGPAVAAAIAGAIVLASAVFVGRRRRMRNQNNNNANASMAGSALDDGTATAAASQKQQQLPEHPQDDENV